MRYGNSPSFPLVEVFAALAIIALFLGVLIPVLDSSRQRRRIEVFKARYKDEIPQSVLNAIARGISTDGDRARADAARKEFNQVADGEKKLDDAVELQRFRKKGQACGPQGDLYERWARFTGNPKGWTRQEFEALAAADQVPELQFKRWAELTRNAKGFTEEQFLALKAKGIISFPTNEKKKEEW